MPRARHCQLCGSSLVERDDGDRRRLACSAEGCGWVFYDNPLPVVAALVEHEGAVLLTRNKGWPEGWYGLVTGFIERGESTEEAALRELKEELGLDGEVVSMIGVYAFTERNELIVAYHVRATGAVVVGDELEGYKRVAPEKLRPWPMGTGHAVRAWLEARRAEGLPTALAPTPR